MASCPSCHAFACAERFHQFLALEFVDPQYGAVHHLTVAAYMLQHPGRLSRDGWRGIRDTLRAFLVEGRTPQEHRARVGEQVASNNRTWSLRKGPHITLPDGFTWSQTIEAVDDSDPRRYCREVEAWARRVLADAETI